MPGGERNPPPAAMAVLGACERCLWSHALHGFSGVGMVGAVGVWGYRRGGSSISPSSPTLLHSSHPPLSAAGSVDRLVHGGVVFCCVSPWRSGQGQTLRFSCHWGLPDAPSRVMRWCQSYAGTL